MPSVLAPQVADCALTRESEHFKISRYFCFLLSSSIEQSDIRLPARTPLGTPNGFIEILIGQSRFKTVWPWSLR